MCAKSFQKDANFFFIRYKIAEYLLKQQIYAGRRSLQDSSKAHSTLKKIISVFAYQLAKHE